MLTLSISGDFLFDLSSLVESIELVQPTVIKENAVRIPSTANYFFGLHDEEWEWTIMEMYMRGVKRITMENRNYSHFTNEQVASVCEVRSLPCNFSDRFHLFECESKG